jgi:hypothetical protein
MFTLSQSGWSEKIPDSAWQNGILDGMTSDTVQGPSVVMGQTVIHRTDTVTHYVLHGQQYIYQADRRTTPRDKPLDITIRGPVNFAIIGATVYVRDEHGTVHKLALVSKSLPQNSE